MQIKERKKWLCEYIVNMVLSWDQSRWKVECYFTCMMSLQQIMGKSKNTQNIQRKSASLIQCCLVISKWWQNEKALVSHICNAHNSVQTIRMPVFLVPHQTIRREHLWVQSTWLKDRVQKQKLKKLIYSSGRLKN